MYVINHFLNDVPSIGNFLFFRSPIHDEASLNVFPALEDVFAKGVICIWHDCLLGPWADMSRGLCRVELFHVPLFHPQFVLDDLINCIKAYFIVLCLDSLLCPPRKIQDTCIKDWWKFTKLDQGDLSQGLLWDKHRLLKVIITYHHLHTHTRQHALRTYLITKHISKKILSQWKTMFHNCPVYILSPLPPILCVSYLCTKQWCMLISHHNEGDCPPTQNTPWHDFLLNFVNL